MRVSNPWRLNFAPADVSENSRTFFHPRRWQYSRSPIAWLRVVCFSVDTLRYKAMFILPILFTKHLICGQSHRVIRSTRAATAKVAGGFVDTAQCPDQTSKGGRCRRGNGFEPKVSTLMPIPLLRAEIAVS